MYRLGAAPAQMREMELDDLFIARLKLLIIMSKAHLNGYPMGQYRKKAVLENADYIKKDAVGLIEDMDLFDEPAGELTFKRGFFQRVKLLAIMAEAFAKGHALAERKQQALVRNLDVVCESITFSKTIDDMPFLKVA